MGQYTQGRLAAIAYGGVYEFYSYTRGGRLTKKRLESAGVKLEVSFEYDSEAKLQYMVYPSGKRVKYTYDDLARHTGLKSQIRITLIDRPVDGDNNWTSLPDASSLVKYLSALVRRCRANSHGSARIRLGVVNYPKYTMQYLADANYTSRFLRTD